MIYSPPEGASMMCECKPIGDAGGPTRRPRILVVDDHEVGRRSLAMLLEALGYEVTSAKDGLSAVAALESSATIDYVLTDLRLPDIDGREVVQAARKLVPSARVALITGWDVGAEESDRLGLDWVFLKPLDVSQIVSELRQVPPADLD